MASSMGIACGGNNRVATRLEIQKRSSLALQPPCSVEMGRSTAKAGRISAAMATEPEQKSPALYGKRSSSGGGGGGARALEGQERLDRWMRESVVEIVKNLREAPLLVQVFPRTGVVTTEKRVVVEDWPAVMEGWEIGDAHMPEGVIFVEELGRNEEEDGASERTTRVWGVVVQGKAAGCSPVCYLLKTCRVGSGTGNGICSTHFCLVKVKDFRETVQSQLKNCWLLQSQFRWD